MLQICNFLYRLFAAGILVLNVCNKGNWYAWISHWFILYTNGECTIIMNLSHGAFILKLKLQASMCT